MLNVLYISHESETVLGSSRSLLNMIQSLKGEVNAMVVVPAKGAAYDYFKSNKIKVHVIHYPLDITDKHGLVRAFSFLPRLYRDFLAYSKAIKNVCNLVSEYKIDIIHSNSSTVDIGYYVARKMNVPHIWHLREFQDLDFHFQPAYGWPRLLRLIRCASATICITKAIQQHFCLDGKSNSYQLFNAVRSEKDICYQPEKDKYFLLCGNLGRAKGCDFAIKAFAQFCLKHSDYRLKFVGSIRTEYKEQLQDLAKSLNVDDIVDFEGYQTDTKKYYSNATAFLMCSPNEAMGRVTIEAMFYGCPVIGYNGGGTKEIVQNGVDGFLFENVGECASLMEEIVENRDISKIVLQAQKKAKELFSEENYRDKVLSIYRKVIL